MRRQAAALQKYFGGKMGIRSALYQCQAASGARFGEYHCWEIAEDFGDPQGEYDAVRRDAGAFDVSYLGKLRVTGRDRTRFLHNLVSNDIKDLKTGSGCYATLLTHQGRMESDLYIYAFEDEYLIECPPAGHERLFQSLNRYIVSDIVAVEDVSRSMAILSIQGLRSKSQMENAFGAALDGMPLLGHRTISRLSGNWIIVHRDRTGCDGFDLWLPAQEAEEVWRNWTTASRIRPIGHRVLNSLRTEAGIPWYGVDMDERNLPLEMGLNSAISLTKGCYRGQEIVARITYRGHLDRKLGAVAVNFSDPPIKGSEILAGGTKIGEVTSSILSPHLRRPLALAVLKTDFLTPGTAVEVAYGSTNYSGEVIALPLQVRPLHDSDPG
jgi:folate-binding protein YgfZ